MKHENRHLRKTGRYSSWNTSIKTKMSRWIEMIKHISSHLIKYPHLFCFYHISPCFSSFIHLPNVCSFIKGMLNCQKYTLKTFLCKNCSWNQMCFFLRFVLFLKVRKQISQRNLMKTKAANSWVDLCLCGAGFVRCSLMAKTI